MLSKPPQWRLAVLLAILYCVCVGSVGGAIYYLYQAALSEDRARLREVVQSQARFAEAVARFDSQHSNDFADGADSATISQIQDAHRNFAGFGRTGEFVVGRREGDNIVFLFRHSGTRVQGLSRAPLADSRAAPMRRAVLGQSGVCTARDYRGRLVLAAYEPVDVLDLGMVAKIDLEEVRAPFIRASLWSGVFSVVLFLGGACAVVRVAKPMARAEKDAAEHYALLCEVLENVPHMIFWKDRNSVYLGCNAAFARAAGLEKAEDVVGKSDFDFPWTAEEAEWFRSCDRKVIEQGEPMLDIEETFQRVDGVEADILTSKAPLRDARGKIIGVLGVIANVTQLKAAEEALREKDEQLNHKHKMEAIGSLAGGISHEFNNLLQAISGYAKFATDELSPEDQSYEDLQQVLAAADRAAVLTRQLLDFSRRGALQRETVEANLLLRDLFAMIRPIIGEQIELMMEMDNEAGTVDVDPNIFHQVLMNLCINARDAMPSGGKLILRTDHVFIAESDAEKHVDIEPGPYVRFSVTDTGCGIPQELQDRVYEPFFTTKENGKGTGLGLSMVYGTVQQHGGGIHLYSEPGVGTTFKIYLPAADSPDSRRDRTTDLQVAGGGETILLAEDEPLVRTIAARILERAGYTVLQADDGEAAIRLVEEQGDTVSLALLDVIMPKLSGRDVQQHIRRYAPHIRVVFCTGYDPLAEQTEIIRQNGLKVIAKPFTDQVLLRTVREVLDADPPAFAEGRSDGELALCGEV